MSSLRTTLRLLVWSTLAVALHGLFPSLALSAPPLGASSPVKQFTLPGFSPEGRRTLLMKGEEAQVLSEGEINVRGMTLTLFTNKGELRPETVLTAASATFNHAEQRAKGTQGVRIVRSDVAMQGSSWSYEHTKKRVVIDGGVQIIFSAQLNDILK